MRVCGIEPLLLSVVSTVSGNIDLSLVGIYSHHTPVIYKTDVCTCALCVVLYHQYQATPLDTASQYGSLHVVRLLLQRGAKIESRDRVRQS